MSAASRKARFNCTGYGNSEDRQRSKDAGFDYHLVKPAGLEEINVIIRSLDPEHAGGDRHVERLS